MTERYFNEKSNEFHDLWLGKLAMDEFRTNFTFMYVPYIQEDKEKVQRFISSIPIFMKELLEFDNPKMMGEAIRKAHICY